MNNARDLGSKSVGVFVLNVLTYVISTLYVVVVGRYIGASVYGQVLYVVSIFSVVEVFTKLGFPNSLVMFLARGDIEDSQKRWLVRVSLASVVVLSVAAMALILFLPGITDAIMSGKSGVDQSMIIMMLPFILNETVIGQISSILRARGEVFRYVFVSSLL